MSTNSFDARTTLEVSGTTYEIFDLHKVEGADTLPFSLKVLLANLLRTEDGANITADDIRALGAWEPSDEPNREIQFTPARVIMQDFTGVPCVVDLATMREAIAEQATVWIGYAEPTGIAADRQVEPLSLSGGYLTAMDLRLERIAMYSVSRITGVVRG